MQTLYMKPSDPTVAGLLARTFPGFSYREVKVSIHDAGGMGLQSCWDGGRRDTHRVIRLADMQTYQIPENGNGFTAADRAFGPAGFPLALPAPGFAVVTLTEGCYKGLTVHIHTENAVKMLPAPCEVSWAEKVVLTATRSLKSSYAGIKDYRYQEAHEATGITRAEWDAAKQALIGRRFLNVAGAITTEGRNAAGTWDVRDSRLKREAYAA